jgi:hypothetical protein
VQVGAHQAEASMIVLLQKQLVAAPRKYLIALGFCTTFLSAFLSCRYQNPFHQLRHQCFSGNTTEQLQPLHGSTHSLEGFGCYTEHHRATSTTASLIRGQEEIRSAALPEIIFITTPVAHVAGYQAFFSTISISESQ